MATSNFGALAEGVKLYTDAMRRFVQQRLIEVYQDQWFAQGVMPALTQPQRANIIKEQEKGGGKKGADYLDAQHIERIILGRWDKVFQPLLKDYKKTQSYLVHASEARNSQFAHSASGDLSQDDAGYALLDIQRMLEAAGQPEATTVAKLRTAVLKLDDPAPVPVEPREAKPAQPGALPFWWQVCEPHDGFKDPARLDESLFAATLGGVYSGSTHRDEYRDPGLFFSHTYFTDGLKGTIRDVASRLSGGAGAAITEMQTPFGGGKTHALLSIYHIFNDPETSLAVAGVREALGEGFTVPPKTRVLVFDGQEYGADFIQKEDTTQVQTLWGELAYQIDPGVFRRDVKTSDEQGLAPGNALFREVLIYAAPCVILIDELVSYLVKLKFGNRRTQNLYKQTVQFLQDLFQEAGNIPGICILFSLPKSQREFGGLDPEQLQRELGVIDELRPRADRTVSKRTPVEDQEIYTLVSKRLFKKVDREAGRRVVEAYRAMHERDRAVYDETVFSGDYEKQALEAYPVHPALIDAIYKKWSTISDFPRTRAVLQLLALIVADQYIYRREAHTIQPAHVNLERERIRTRIISAAGGGGWDGVVAADIIGGDAHADDIDTRHGDPYERQHIARGVATTIMLHSFGGQSGGGALPSDVFLGNVAPNLEPQYVAGALDDLDQRLWYVHREGELRRFETRPNIVRIIAETAERQPIPLIEERLRTAVGEVTGLPPGFRAIAWAGADGTLADSPEPTVALLAATYAVESENGTPPITEAITRLFERSGGGFRQFRNALILVAPDADLWRRAHDAMREVLAYDAVLIRKDLKDDRDELQARRRDKLDSLKTAVINAYRLVYFADENGLRALALPQTATKQDLVAKRVVERLAAQDYGDTKILDRGMGANYFAAKVLPRHWDSEDPVDLRELYNAFPKWSDLPILPDRDGTLRRCIREGLDRKPPLWAIAIGDVQSSNYQQLIETAKDFDTVATPFDGSAALVRGAMLDLIREQLAPPVLERPDDPGVDHPEPPVVTPPPEPHPPVHIPLPAKRHSRVRINLASLPIAKTANLQPYLFKAIQEADATADLSLTIHVRSSAGLTDELLNDRIREGFDQLGIGVEWDAE